MENYKVKVSSEAESKEVQNLLFDLGYMVVNNMDCEKGYIVASKNAESPINFDYWHNVENIVTLAELRDMVASQHSNDEPFLTPECTLNDQYAEIEQVRQAIKVKSGSDSDHSADAASYGFFGFKPKNAWDIQVGGNHYKDMKIQPAQFAMENNLDYLQGNAIKYICRHKSKNGLQDLEKAKHYIELMIEHFYK